MAYTAIHGPPMLDAKHQFVPPVGANPPVLGDSHKATAVYPHIVIDRINGWRSLPELVDNRAPRTFGMGEIPYPSRTLGKTLVYECRIEAETREGLLQYQQPLVQGFGSGADAEGVMTVTPWAVPGGVVWTYSARCLSLEFDPSWVLRGTHRAAYEWGFTITLRMSDPLFYTGGVGYF